jgi:copper chaperone CopZ
MQAPAEKLTLEVKGMHCAGCVATVEKNLKAQPGVIEAAVNLTTERALVHFSPQRISPNKLVEAVNAAGYQAAVLSEQAPRRVDGAGDDIDDTRNDFGTRARGMAESTRQYNLDFGARRRRGFLARGDDIALGVEFRDARRREHGCVNCRRYASLVGDRGFIFLYGHRQFCRHRRDDHGHSSHRPLHRSPRPRPRFSGDQKIIRIGRKKCARHSQRQRD